MPPSSPKPVDAADAVDSTAVPVTQSTSDPAANPPDVSLYTEIPQTTPPTPPVDAEDIPVSERPGIMVSGLLGMSNEDDLKSPQSDEGYSEPPSDNSDSYIVINGDRTDLTDEQAADLAEELRQLTSENSPRFIAPATPAVPFGSKAPSVLDNGPVDANGRMTPVIVRVSRFVETTEEALKAFTDSAAAGAIDVSTLRGRHFFGIVRETPEDLGAISVTAGSNV